jgi:hypothetical protein
MDVIYDLETYPNLFLCGVKIVDGGIFQFEISERRDDFASLTNFVSYCELMIGFNNLHFDYPVLHNLLWLGKYNPHGPELWWPKVRQIFTDDDKFAHRVPGRNWICPQMDLFLIHHFDNKSRSTSLKKLQFAMRSDKVEDLPIAPGTMLTLDQMDEIASYNQHDLTETEKFFHRSASEIEFRAELGPEYMNYNDTKIGKQFMVRALEREQPGICYTRDRAPRQTWRPGGVKLANVIFPYVRFQRSGFASILETLRATTIINTRQEHQIETTVDGLTYSFGTGGMHASVKNAVVTSDNDHVILDVDVAGYYPALAIANGLYPEHLGPLFCEKMAQIRDERNRVGKRSHRGKALKFAGNGVYGDSNNVHSPFYDPQYTMTTTVNGQLLMAMLIEAVSPHAKIVQANTDGATLLVLRDDLDVINHICERWQAYTLLTLEIAEYSRMWIRDVNSYIAERADGTLKRKGAYEYELEWHKNHSALVVPRAAEAAMVRGVPLEQFIQQHDDPFDFMLLAKGPKLEPTGTKHLRYYVSTSGAEIIKIMPPLKGKAFERRIAINKGRLATPCNVMPKELTNIDYDFYIRNARKLVIS